LNSTLNSNRSFTTLEEKKEQHKKCNKQFFENNKNEILEHQKTISCMKFQECLSLD